MRKDEQIYDFIFMNSFLENKVQVDGDKIIIMFTSSAKFSFIFFLVSTDRDFFFIIFNNHFEKIKKIFKWFLD